MNFITFSKADLFKSKTSLMKHSVNNNGVIYLYKNSTLICILLLATKKAGNTVTEKSKAIPDTQNTSSSRSQSPLRSISESTKQTLS